MRKNCIVDLSVEGLLLQRKKDKGGARQTAFSVKVVFRDGHVRVIHRIYGQFVKLQDRVIDTLKKNGRRPQSKTLLPKLQGPRFISKDDFKKMEKLNHFLKSLLALPEEIIALDLISDFFMADDASSETSKGQNEDGIDQIEMRLVQEADSTSNIVETIYKNCYTDTSWKPQDLHRLPDRTLGKLHQRLSESDAPNCSKPLGGFQSISAPSKIVLRRNSSYDCELHRGNGHLTSRNNQEQMVPSLKKFHSEMDLNSNTLLYDTREIHNISGRRQSINSKNGRRNGEELKASSRKDLRSETQLNTIAGFATSSYDTLDARSVTSGFSDTFRSNHNLHPGLHNRTTPQTSDMDTCSTASSTELESHKSEKLQPRNRRSTRRQLPPTPTMPSRILFDRNVSAISPAAKSERAHSSTSGPLHVLPRKLGIAGIATNASLDGCGKPPVRKSASLPEEPVSMDRKQDGPVFNRLYSWPGDAGRVGCLRPSSNFRSTSPLSFSSLDLTVYAASDTSSESELSSGGESIQRVFAQARRRDRLQNGTLSLQSGTICETKSYKGVFDSHQSHTLTEFTNTNQRGYGLYTAMHCYSADGNGELSLVEGEEVMVIEKSSSGWWFVLKVDQQKGWTPSNFLRYTGCFPAQGPRTCSRTPQCYHRDLYVWKIPEEDLSQQDRCSLTKSPDVFESQHPRNRGDIATLTTEIAMNRNIKFLTVEGIQKRKDPDKNYVYVLKVVWSDGTINIIYRKCSDFFRLQEDLKKEFPDDVGGDQIPVLKGRKFYENCKFCFKDGSCKRMNFLNQFCHELVNAQVRISRSEVVLNFCKPRHEDLNPQTAKQDKKSKKDASGKSNGGEVISSPVIFEQHIAVAPYKKQCKNDISLDAGDIVDVIEKNEYGWWLVDREGELGWAPASYLEPMDDGADNVITTQKFGPGEEEVYMSIKEHRAEAPDEISFDVGVMLQVLQKTLDGWWLIRYHGREGWAPAMVLKKVDNNSERKKKIPVTTGLRTDIDLDIVSFSGEKETNSKNEFPFMMSRNPPARRSTVRRTIKKRPKYRIDGSQAEKPIKEDLRENSKSLSRSSSASLHSTYEDKPKSESMPPNYSPTPRPRTPKHKAFNPRVPPRTISKNYSLSEIDTFFKTHHPSASSSGYDSSPGGSMSSLPVSETQDEGGELEENRLGPFDTMSAIGKSNPRRGYGMRRVRSSTELPMQHEVEQERERAATLSARPSARLTRGTPVQSRPTPAPRKISLTKSPLASQGSIERSQSPKEMAVYKNAGLEGKQQLGQVTSVSDYENDDSDSSGVALTNSEETSPRNESSESLYKLEKQAALEDDPDCYSPTEDTVFNGEPEQHDSDKEDLAGSAESSRYRATSCYDGEEEHGEVRFSEGEIIEVIERNETGWWYLKAKGGSGWGPSTFLEAIEA